MIKLLFFLFVSIPSSRGGTEHLVPSVDTIDRADISFNVNRNIILKSINEIRAKGCKCGGKFMKPAPPVSWNNQLAQAALQHSRDMKKKDYFGHVSKSGSNPGDRIRAAGYKWIAYGENIAFNDSDERSVIDGWLKSVNHCKTIMNPIYKEVGVAREGAYWTQDFGTR
ncbi:MAG TPA: CAP domain-containing protein [Chitinophagaceae bacterium]